MGYKILSKKELCPNQYELTIHAPYVTKNAKAGQFIILRVSKDGERIPLTIADYDRDKGELTIVFMAVGYTMYMLSPSRFLSARVNIRSCFMSTGGSTGNPRRSMRFMMRDEVAASSLPARTAALHIMHMPTATASPCDMLEKLFSMA